MFTNYVSIPCWVFSSLRPRGGGRGSASHSVSIPCWVFSSLRLMLHAPTVSAFSAFQSRAGFSPRCDMDYDGDSDVLVLFQSRAGFSPRCDLIEEWDINPQGPFQSRAGFSPRCDEHGPAVIVPALEVSIPCWVFSSLRPRGAPRRRPGGTCFNPVLGFLLAATGGDQRRPSCGAAGFNPVLGFLLAATERDRGGLCSA